MRFVLSRRTFARAATLVRVRGALSFRAAAFALRAALTATLVSYALAYFDAPTICLMRRAALRERWRRVPLP
jgi:hypothetical protein